MLSDKVDIAHARLEFAGGAVANVTASRVSTERVRKVRFFQQHEYISLDYARRDALRVGVKRPGPEPEFAFEKLPSTGVEPLRAELEAFLYAVRTRKEPKTDGAAGRAALELATRVMACIQEHAARVQPTGSHPAVGFARVSPSEKRREMIPRSLVPFDARPSTLEPTSRRRPSTLDDRTLVPSGLALAPLETISSIPATCRLNRSPSDS